MRHVNIVVNPDFPDIRELAAEIARDGVPSQAEVIYDARNRLYRLHFEGMTVCIKAFHRPAGVNTWVYGNFRRGKARRSYENAMEMRRLGFASPTPLAYVEITYGKRFDLSYYLYEYISDSVYLRDWEKRPDAAELADAIASEMAKLHAAGIFHKDFTPGNIFVKRTNRGFSFSYIDINRMEFGVTDRKRLLDNFRGLTFDRNMLCLLARSYASKAGLDPDKTEAEALHRLDAFLDRKTLTSRLRGRTDAYEYYNGFRQK